MLVHLLSQLLDLSHVFGGGLILLILAQHLRSIFTINRGGCGAICRRILRVGFGGKF